MTLIICKFYFLLFINFFNIISKKKKKTNKKKLLEFDKNNFIFSNRFCFNKLFYKENGDNIVDKCYNKINSLPKISVLSAVYNKEIFVSQLIKGSQIQSLKHIEIIIVDDGSYDKSSKIVQYYMKYDPRIILIKNKKNRGILYTKSIGFMKSKGMYIKSVDGDDMLCVKDMLENLLKFAKK